MTIPNYEKLQKLYEELNSKGGGESFGENFLKVEEDKPVYVRILPAKNDEEMFYSKTIRHEFKLGNSFHYVQSRTITGEDCPLGNLYYELWDLHEQFCTSNGMDPKDKDTITPYKIWARAIKPKEKFFINVVTRDDESKVKILSCTEALMNKIVGAMLEKEPDGTPMYGDITSLHDGNDFKILLSKGKNGFLNYNESQVSPKKKPAGTSAQIEAWMDSLHDLNALVKPSSTEEIMTIVEELRTTIESQVAEFEKKLLEKTSSRSGRLAAAMEGK